MAPRRDLSTMDLLTWKPPAPPASFEPEVVRAASMRASMAKAVSAALRDAIQSRDVIAAEMSAYLGEPVTKGMLDAYASESREEHVINVIRLQALVHATRDYRLLQMIAEAFGMVLIEKRYLPAIEQAVLDDKIAELKNLRDMANRKWRTPT